MAKRFKLRICRVITTTLQSCRSKDPDILPQHPVPSFNHKQQNHRRPSSKHRLMSSAFTSIGCGFPSNGKPSDDDLTASHSQQFKWEKEEKWHVVANVYQKPTPRRKIYNSSASGEDSDDTLTFANPTPPEKTGAEKKKRRAKKKKNVPSRLRMSTSSADSGWFSSEGGGGAVDQIDVEETETLVSSSISFSTDSSSEFHPHLQLQPIRETHPFTTNLPQRRNKRRPSKRTKRGVSRPPESTSDGEIPARLSMFRKLIPCTVDGKVKESFAIVKKSEDPYEDFKSSMMDMIVEKQMFEHKDLEQLLQCFLSLNSRQYHGIIVQVFYEIWEAIFSPETSKPASHHHHHHHQRVN